MKRSRFSEEQVTYALRQAEGGTPVREVCRQLGVSEATFYVWKKKYGQLGVSELRRLRQLEDENARLKHLVADLTLDKHILTETIRKNRWRRHVVESGHGGSGMRSRSRLPVRVGSQVSRGRRGTGAARRATRVRCACAFGSSRWRGPGSGTCGFMCCFGARVGG